MKIKKHKNTIRVYEPTPVGYKDSGLRVSVTRFRNLSAFWRSVLKTQRLELCTPLEDWDEADRLIISEPYAGHGFVEDGCLQDSCPDDKHGLCRACQFCHCASRSGSANYFYVPSGARIWAQTRRARKLESERKHQNALWISWLHNHGHQARAQELERELAH